jgi:hypothetical protein
LSVGFRKFSDLLGSTATWTFYDARRICTDAESDDHARENEDAGNRCGHGWIGGIGRATAIALARHGYWVGILARDATRVEAVCEEIRGAGGYVLGIPTDVADAARVEHSANRIEHELGVISV